MARRTDLLNKITKQLAVLACEVELMNRSNRMTLNSDAETIFCGLINRLEGWDLRNLNEVAQNYPGIDLADQQRRIAVQITASASQKKVDHTLEVFFKNKLEQNFDRLVLVIITDRAAPTAAHGVKLGFKFDPKRDIWNIEWFKRRVESIEDCELLQAVADFLDSQLGDLPGTVKRPDHLLPAVPGASEFFLAGSRDTELDTLEKALAKGGPVFIWGLGGMGKTETAIQLARRCEPPRGAYFLRYTVPADPRREAMWETIRRADLSGYTLAAGDETDPGVLMEKEYREKLEILRREYEDTLLIIDNFDCPGKSMEMLKAEGSYRDVASLVNHGVSLVFTTRYPADPDWEVGPLPEKLLLELMRRSCTDYEDTQLLELIQAAGSHTLMVDLMAKTLEESWQTVTPEQILEALKNAALDIADFPEVTSDKDGLFAQAQIYKHLQALFNLAGLNEAAKKVLALATLIADEGLDDVLFLESLPSGDRKELQNLCKRGWLRREKHIITIHPAVLQVSRGELQPDKGQVQVFLDGLWTAQEKRNCSDETLRRVALCLNAGAAGIGDMTRSMDLRLKALSIWERILRPDHPELAVRYTDMGLFYHTMGENRKALQYTKKSLQIKKSILPRDHPDLAMTYRYLHSTLTDLFEEEESVEYQQKVLDIWKNVLPPDHPDLGRACFLMGKACIDARQYALARDNLEQAMAILSPILPNTHPEMMQVNQYLGRVYGYLGDFRSARECLELALRAFRQAEDTQSLEYGFLCLDCAEVYEKLGLRGQRMLCSEAMRLYQKALDIFERELPEGDFWRRAAWSRIDYLQSKMEPQK